MKYLYKIMVAAILLMPALLNAQVTTGTIEGKFVDEKGQPVNGGKIKATHLPSGSVYGAYTKANGGFQLNGLRVGGPYKVEASSMSSGSVTVDDIYVRLGEPTVLGLKANETAQQIQQVLIKGNKNSIINADKTGASTNVTAQQMMSLPTVSRSITDFTRLSPQSGTSFSSGLNNANTFGGRDGRYNSFQVNGANLNNGFGLSSALTPGYSGQPISLDAIEEMQIGVSRFAFRHSPNGFHRRKHQRHHTLGNE